MMGCAWCGSVKNNYKMIVNDQEWYNTGYCSDVCCFCSIFDVLKGSGNRSQEFRQERVKAALKWMQSPKYAEWLDRKGFVIIEDNKGLYTKEYLTKRGILND